VFPTLDLVCEQQCIIDSSPIPESSAMWRACRARSDEVSLKKYFFRLQIASLITLGDLSLDFGRGPIQTNNFEVDFELLNAQIDLEVQGNKSYTSAERVAELLKLNRFHPQTLPKSNQKKQPSP